MSSNPYPEPKEGWPRGAKLIAALLAAIAVGLGGWAHSARSTANTNASTIAELNDDLGRARKDSQALEGELNAAQSNAQGTVTDAEQKIAAVQTDLATVTAERDAAQAQAAAYAAFFPMNMTTMAQADSTGSYSVDVAPIADTCVGYQDPVIACAPESFPAAMDITGDATAGFTVSSAWFDPMVLTFDGTTYRATGPLREGYGGLCDDFELPTDLTITIAPFAVTPHPAGSGLKAVSLAGTFKVSTAEGSTCIAASHSANVLAALL